MADVAFWAILRRAGAFVYFPPAMFDPPGTCRRLTSADSPLLEEFFRILVASGDAATFHPHPFTNEAAAWICGHCSSDPSMCDEYHAVLEEGRIVGYGMLRGWAQGYSTPSLGIAVAPGRRGHGIAGALMRYLHHVAAVRGARAIRLKVYRTNTPAIRLYCSFGYRLTPYSAAELLGQCSLDHAFAT